VYARARLAGAATGGPLRQVAIKFVAFPLLPALVLFYTHQHIAYGGFWGQWVLESPGSWLTTLATHWLTVAIYCVIYASVWRGLAEAAAIAAARIAPAYATRVRRAAEIACLALYYGGVPALLVARYLA
jgi:apolipoprotein N-acyltransferase